jgi:hypothetical protein
MFDNHIRRRHPYAPSKPICQIFMRQICDLLRLDDVVHVKLSVVAQDEGQVHLPREYQQDVQVAPFHQSGAYHTIQRVLKQVAAGEKESPFTKG